METTVYKKVQKILVLILFANVLVAIMKIVLGMLIKSASMTADGFHSLSDGSSNVVGLIGIRLAASPKDEDHPYGHHKFETMTGMIISAFLFVVAANIIIQAIDRFKNPVAPNITVASLVVLLVTLAINIVVAVTEFRQGKKLNSAILVSDSMHTRSDIYVSIGVLVTLLGIKLGLPIIIDPIASLIVGGFIIYAGLEIFKENSSILLDRAAVDPKEIERIALSFEEIHGVHKIRSRGTQNCTFIDLHIQVDPDLSIERTHALTHDLEKAYRKEIHENVQLITHVEPYRESEAG